MDSTTVMRGAEARCATCGAPDVWSLCHHCGRPLCREHGRPDGDPHRRPDTEEFTGLDIVGTRHQEAPVHCDDCRHILRRPPWGLLALGSALVVAGRLIQQELPRQGSWVALLGLMLALTAGGLIWLRIQARRAAPPLVPLAPRFGEIEATEWVEGSMSMTADGTWTSAIRRRFGELCVHTTFGPPERRVVDAYLHRLRPPGARRDLSFSAGFLLLRQRVLGELESREATDRAGALVVPVKGRLGDVPFLSGEQGRGDRTWEARWTYRILDDETAWSDDPPEIGSAEALPLRLVPSLVPDSDGRALELELRWSAGVSGSTGADRWVPVLDRPRIEELTVDVPTVWGEVTSFVVQGSTGGLTEGSAPQPEDADGPVRRLCWRGVSLETDMAGSGRARLHLQFDRRVDPQARLRGTVTVGFRGGISGLRSIDLFDPIGGLRSEDQAKIRTLMVAGFDMHLDLLHHRTLRVLSDLGAGEEEAPGRGRPLVAAGVAPDHVFVLRLARELRRARFHIHRIEEEPPRVGSEGLGTNRLWDLSGQYRSDLHVYELHLIVGGEDGQGASGPQGSTGKISATLRGTVSDAASERGLEAVWATLREIVGSTVAAAQSEVVTGDPKGPSGEVPSGRPAEQQRLVAEPAEPVASAAWTFPGGESAEVTAETDGAKGTSMPEDRVDRWSQN